MTQLPPNVPTPDSRAYVHTACGSGTVISGWQFKRLSDPFSLVQETYCVECESHFPMNQVAWTDTGEMLNDYRDRQWAATPAFVRYWRCGIGAIVGAMLGAVVGWIVYEYVMQPPKIEIDRVLILYTVLGAPIVFLLGVPVLNLIYGIDYRRRR